MEATGKAFVDHWNWAAEKGVMNKNTAAGLRSASTQVLGALDNWEALDIAHMDVEDALVRFQNLKAKDFKPSVLETYKRRFRQAVRSYLSYLNDPGSWKPRTLDRAVAGDKSNGANSQPESRVTKREPPQEGTVEYPFPLREGQTARLILPRDLKTSEVKRLAAFMSALAVDFDPAPTAV